MRLSLVVLVMAGCVGAGGGPQQQSRAERRASNIDRQQEQLPGAYSCRFEARDEELDDAACEIQGRGESMQLSMSGGEHRLSGQLRATDAGFRFAGEYSCSTGDDCKETIETDFFEQSPGQYQGMVALENGKLLSVTLQKR